MFRNVASERTRLGLTQEEFAEALGISKAQAYRLETEGVEPSGETLLKITELCECSADYLLGLTPERTRTTRTN